jgi:hypothetical protein
MLFRPYGFVGGFYSTANHRGYKDTGPYHDDQKDGRGMLRDFSDKIAKIYTDSVSEIVYLFQSYFVVYHRFSLPFKGGQTVVGFPIPIELEILAPRLLGEPQEGDEFLGQALALQTRVELLLGIVLDCCKDEVPFLIVIDDEGGRGLGKDTLFPMGLGCFPDEPHVIMGDMNGTDIEVFRDGHLSSSLDKV